jgi:hypothetical protein
MDWLNENSGAIQAVATIVLVVLTAAYATLTLILARSARRQLEATRRASEGQAVLSIVTFLQIPQVREARAIVRNMNRPSDWESEWSKKEQNAVSLVCSSYDAAAMLITSGLVEAEPFTTTWGPSIIACYDVCEPYVLSMRERASGSTYWSSFEAVARAASEKLPLPLPPRPVGPRVRPRSVGRVKAGVLGRRPIATVRHQCGARYHPPASLGAQASPGVHLDHPSLPAASTCLH